MTRASCLACSTSYKINSSADSEFKSYVSSGFLSAASVQPRSPLPMLMPYIYPHLAFSTVFTYCPDPEPLRLLSRLLLCLWSRWTLRATCGTISPRLNIAHTAPPRASTQPHHFLLSVRERDGQNFKRFVQVPRQEAPTYFLKNETVAEEWTRRTSSSVYTIYS